MYFGVDVISKSLLTFLLLSFFTMVSADVEKRGINSITKYPSRTALGDGADLTNSKDITPKLYEINNSIGDVVNELNFYWTNYFISSIFEYGFVDITKKVKLANNSYLFPTKKQQKSSSSSKVEWLRVDCNLMKAYNWGEFKNGFQKEFNGNYEQDNWITSKLPYFVCGLSPYGEKSNFSIYGIDVVMSDYDRTITGAGWSTESIKLTEEGKFLIDIFEYQYEKGIKGQKILRQLNFGCEDELIDKEKYLKLMLCGKNRSMTEFTSDEPNSEEENKIMIDKLKKECQSIGYTPDTSKFRKCVLELM